MRGFRHWLLLVMLASLGFASGCAFNQSDIGGFNIISIDQEVELGNKFAGEVEKQSKVVSDPEVQSYVDGIGRRLLTGARAVEFAYTFKVVKDDSVNAFAIPGGHVYVNSGLIKAAASETELAAVMAHEINHAVARHGTRQLTQQYGYSLIVQLLLGQDPNLLAQLATSLFGKAGFMAYSRGMENQADFLGAETMYKAGYNPEGMLTFFSKLDAMQKQSPSKLAQFFSSHPLTGERVRQVREEIAQLPPKSFKADDSASFQRIRARVERLP